MFKKYTRRKRLVSVVLTFAMICTLLVPIGTVGASELPGDVGMPQLQPLQADAPTPETPKWEPFPGNGGRWIIDPIKGSAHVEFGALEGYQRERSMLTINDSRDGGSLYPDIYDSNLSSVTVSTYADYELTLSLDFNSLQDPLDSITYIDKKILKGWEVNQLTKWEVDANYPQLTIAPEVRAAGGDFYVQLANMKGDYKFLTYHGTLNPYHQTKLIISPGKHRFSWTSTKEKLFLYSDLFTSDGQVIDFNQAKADAVELIVNANSDVRLVDSWNVTSGSGIVGLFDYFPSEEGTWKYLVTKGIYGISFDQQVTTIDGKRGVAQWWNNNLEINGSLSIGNLQPEGIQLSVDERFVTGDGLITYVNIMSGNYSLTSYYQIDSDSELGYFELYLDDEWVKSWESSDWYSQRLNLDNRLSDGRYELRFSLNYGGQEFKQSTSFQVGNRDHTLNGYVMKVEDQAGNPLENASMSLYEHLPVENITSDMQYTRIFRDTLENGELFIPNANLLHGKNYVLLVEGTDQKGNPIIYQRQFTMNDVPPLQLTGDQLKSIQLTHSIENISGTVAINIAGTDLLSNRLEMNSQDKVIWLSSNVRADVIADLSDSKKETKYYLKQPIDTTSSQVIKLDQDTVELVLPEHFPKEDVGIRLNGRGASSAYYKKIVVSSESQDISVLWYLSKNGYKYNFYTYFNPTEDKPALDIPNEVQGFAEYLGGELTIFYQEHNSLNRFSSVEALSGAPATIYTYQLYDAENKAIGGPIVTNNIQLYALLTNLKNGQYRIKLLQTNVPSDVVKLKLDATFEIGQSNKKLLPIELPAELASVNEWESYATISELSSQSDGTYKVVNKQNRLIDAGKKLDVYYKKDANTLYQVYVYISGNHSTKYIRKLILSGEQLDKLTTLPLSSNEGALQITIPSTNQMGTLFVDSFYDKLASSDGFNIPSNTLTSNVKILGDIEQTRIQYMDVDGETVFSLHQLVPKGTSDLAIDLNALKTAAVPVQFNDEAGKPMQLAAIGVDTKGTDASHMYGRWLNYDQQSVSRLLVSPGEYKFNLLTLDKRANETPWLSTWSTNGTFNVQKEMTLKFNDKLDKQEMTKLTFDYPYGSESIGAVRGAVTLGNADWSLQQVSNMRENPYMMQMKTSQVQRPYDGNFDYLNEVKPAITIKDEAGNVVKQTVAEGRISAFEVPYFSLAEGNYSLEWIQPIAPLKSVTFTKNFTAKYNPDPEKPTEPETPTNPVNPVFPGGGFGGAPSDKHLNTIDERALKLQADGTYEVDATNVEQTDVLLTAEALKKLGEATLHIVTSFGTIQLDASAIQEWSKQNSNGQLLLRFAYPTSEEQQAIADTAGNSKRADVKPVGHAVEVQLFIRAADGKDIAVSSVPAGMKLTLKLDKDAAATLFGLYKWNADGTLTFVGGKVRDGQIEANVLESGKYSVFSYEKTFVDVPSWHWAQKFITELSAKHLIQGISDTKFAPERAIKRAEFATLLVRMLELKSTASSAFKDVANDAWYAEAIAAAVEHGLIKGVSTDQFQPNREITRAELAVMLERVLTSLKLKGTEPVEGVSFSDANAIATWAQEAAQAVTALELMAAKDGKFNGSTAATRAEAAKAMQGLLQLLNR